MVAKITVPRAAERTLAYNERKVEKGKAVCLGGDNYLVDSRLVSAQKRHSILEHRNALNDRATTKTLHVSLNFSSGEKLSEDKLIQIASFYMSEIGFGEQPYFIYQHHDAGHPHIHIVSTTIREDGSRINTHNIGRNQSEKARKETERHFGLNQSKDKKMNARKSSVVTNPSKAIYGKEETKQSIASILEAVLPAYNYNTLAGLNAILKQYNVVADSGQKSSRIHEKKGLYYRMIDEKGIKIGVPIKASSLPGKPTLSNLAQHFTKNEMTRSALQRKLETVIADILNQSPEKTRSFKSLLMERQIVMFLRTYSESKMQEITFIDNKNKSVFNEKEINPKYRLADLQNQLKGEVEELDLSVHETISDKHKKSSTDEFQPESKVLNKSMKQISTLQKLKNQKPSIAHSTVILPLKTWKAKQKNCSPKI